MRLFGLDMSDSMFRLAVLERHGNAFRLPVRGEIPVPSGIMNDGDILQPDVVSELLRRLVAAARPKTNRSIVTLPERHSFIKLIRIPAGQAATDDTVKTAIMPHVPYNWGDMSFDWRALPPASSSAEIPVLFGGAPSKIVQAYLDVLEKAGLETVSMEIESIAIARALLAPKVKGAHILLDMGRTRTSLILVNDGVVEFSTTIRYAGKDLNEYLADALGISLDQAQRAKELFGLDPNKGKGLLARVLAPQLDVLADKIQSIQSFYEEHYETAEPITSIMLNGSGALIRNIDLELSKRLEEPVRIQPSWIVQQLTNDPSEVKDIAFSYTTALGLALQPYSGFK